MTKENIVIFGAGKLGRLAYIYLEDMCNILFFLDNDKNKWGNELYGIKIISPEDFAKIENFKDIKVVIASYFQNEIYEQLNNLGVNQIDSFNTEISNLSSYKNIKKLNLGHLLCSLDAKELQIGELTFLFGTSSVLDYAFLKAIILKLELKNYLEIGTFTGESIAAVSDVCEKCFSVSLPDTDPIMTQMFYKSGKENFSRFISKKKKNIIYYKEDSKKFDFTKIKEKIDLVFIDGDHSYEGIRSDTEKVFEFIDDENTIVVWHDFRNSNGELITTTINAIFDTLPQNKIDNIFAVDNSMCGVYIPNKYLDYFSFEQKSNELHSYLTTIKPMVNIKGE